MTTREEAVNFIWDVYKDIHGFRPRFMDFDSMSQGELEAECQSLVNYAREEEEYENRKIEEAAIAANTSVETIKRWIAEEEEFDIFGCPAEEIEKMFSYPYEQLENLTVYKAA